MIPLQMNLDMYKFSKNHDDARAGAFHRTSAIEHVFHFSFITLT